MFAVVAATPPTHPCWSSAVWRPPFGFAKHTHHTCCTYFPRIQHAQVGVVDALPRSASSVTHPDTHGDDIAAAGGESFVPVEAETPGRPERPQRKQQREPSEAFPSRPPIQTVGSNVESVVGSWEGAEVDQSRKSSPAASPPVTLSRRGLDVVLDVVLDVDPTAAAAAAAAGGAVAAVAGGVQNNEVHSPISSETSNGGREEREAPSGQEDEPKEASSLALPTPINARQRAEGNAGSLDDTRASNADCAAHSPGRTGSESAAQGPLSSPAAAGNYEEDGAAVGTVAMPGAPGAPAAGAAGAAPGAATSSSAPTLAVIRAAAGSATGASPFSSGTGKEEEEEEEGQVTVSCANNPLYQSGLGLTVSPRPAGSGDACSGSSTGGMSRQFSPVRVVEVTGGNATRGGGARGGAGRGGADRDGAAAAETSTDPTGGSAGGGRSSTSKAATMVARFRSAARGGSASLFSRRASVASDPPMPPAPDAGPAERAPPPPPMPPLPPPHPPAPPGSEGAANCTGTGAPTDGESMFSGRFGRRSRNAKTKVAPEGDVVLPAPHGPDFDKKSGCGGAGTAPAFGDGGALGKTPLVSPLRSSSLRTAGSAAAASAFSPDAPTRTGRGAEGDVEAGGALAAVASAAAAAAEPVTSQIMLPCAPTDKEKVTLRLWHFVAVREYAGAGGGVPSQQSGNRKARVALSGTKVAGW